MLETPNFWTLMRETPRRPGVLMVVSLATAEAIGDIGIPALDEAGRRMWRAMEQETPAGVQLGWLGKIIYGLYLPGADEQRARDLAGKLQDAMDREAETELVPGEWEEMRLVTAVVMVEEDGWDVLEALRLAIQRAKEGPRKPPEHYLQIFDEEGELLAS